MIEYQLNALVSTQLVVFQVLRRDGADHLLAAQGQARQGLRLHRLLLAGLYRHR